MIDIEKAIEEVEEKQDAKFTEEQRKSAEGLGMFLGLFWNNTKEKDSCGKE